MTFDQALQSLRNGDFTLLDPIFGSGQIVEWLDEGRFMGHPAELNEALTCACFNGHVGIAMRMMATGVDPLAGNGTGLDGFHWAANRGQLAVVKLLLNEGVSTESRNHYGGTVLGATIWAVLNEPRDHQIEVIDALLQGGALLEDAQLEELGFPTPNERLNETLRRHGAV